MFKDAKAFSSFSSNDIARAKQFYGETLGLDVSDEMDGLALHLAGGGEVFIYPKDNHSPATFTVLNLPVPNIDEAVDKLTAAGVTFEHYEGMGQDEKGILRDADGGPTIAWFTDPAGNVLSVMEGSG